MMSKFKESNIGYKQVQFIDENDTRTIEERTLSLPFVRNEDLPEWEEWWDRTMNGFATNVFNYR